MASSVGQFVGMYDFLGTLGEGHFAVVKLAQHVITKEKVAIKIIDKSRLTDQELQHLHHEVRVMKLIRHSHIVRLYQVVDTSSKLYLILEWGQGGDLYEYITKHGRLPEDKARAIFRQIVRALFYCHKHHIAHRDLKPENIVFKTMDFDHVQITDFGLSNNFNPGEMMQTMCGSLAYSAPEVLLHEPYDGPCADVWSLGIILYMLVCGKLPFREHCDSETLVKILDVTYDAPAYLSSDCKSLLRALISREPCDRMTLEQIQHHKWYLDGHQPDSKSDSRSEIKTRLMKEDHEAVLRAMSKANFDRESVQKAVDEGSYDFIASTYYLLADQQLRKKRKAERERESGASGVGHGMSAVGEEAAHSPHSSPDSSPKGLRRTKTMHSKSPTHSEKSGIVSTSEHKGSIRLRKPRPNALSMNDESKESGGLKVVQLEAMSLSPRFSSGEGSGKFGYSHTDEELDSPTRHSKDTSSEPGLSPLDLSVSLPESAFAELLPHFAKASVPAAPVQASTHGGSLASTSPSSLVHKGSFARRPLPSQEEVKKKEDEEREREREEERERERRRNAERQKEAERARLSDPIIEEDGDEEEADGQRGRARYSLPAITMRRTQSDSGPSTGSKKFVVDNQDPLFIQIDEEEEDESGVFRYGSARDDDLDARTPLPEEDEPTTPTAGSPKINGFHDAEEEQEQESEEESEEEAMEEEEEEEMAPQQNGAPKRHMSISAVRSRGLEALAEDEDEEEEGEHGGEEAKNRGTGMQRSEGLHVPAAAATHPNDLVTVEEEEDEDYV